MKTHMVMAVTALVLLSACGGGGPGNVNPSVPVKQPGTPVQQPGTPVKQPGTPSRPGTPTQPVKAAPTVNALDARLDAAVAARNAVSNLAPTRAASVPTSGSATFAGPALMKVSKGAVSYEMVGDSRLAVNFGTHQMGGNITNIQGQRGNGTTFSAGGQIDYETGVFPTGRNVFGVDYDGVITVGKDRIALDGRAVGGFYGNPSGGGTSAIQAVDGTPGTEIIEGTRISNMTARLNGQPATGQILIIGQKQ